MDSSEWPAKVHVHQAERPRVRASGRGGTARPSLAGRRAEEVVKVVLRERREGLLGQGARLDRGSGRLDDRAFEDEHHFTRLLRHVGGKRVGHLRGVCIRGTLNESAGSQGTGPHAGGG
eukprot:scaffold23495_cov112-Isochrysis_galbana.AAC.6